MNIDEAVDVIIVSQKYSVAEWIVKRCVDQFVSRIDKKWAQLQKHKRFSELEPSMAKRITDERIDYLEERLYVGNPWQSVEQCETAAVDPRSFSSSCRRCGSVNIRNSFRV